MKKLTFCASAVFLAPSLMAFSLKSFKFSGVGMEDTQFSVNIGSRLVNIGDRTSSNGQNLLGDGKTTPTTAAHGTVTSLYHVTPMASLSGSTLLKIGQGDRFTFRVAAEVQLSNTKSNTIYDGVSKAGKVTLATYPARIVELYTYGGTMYGETGYDTVEAATVSLKEVIGGKRECTVSHQPAYGLRILYNIGRTTYGGNVGIGVMRTQDSYSYVVEETKAAAEGAGIYSASNASYGISITTVVNNTLDEALNVIPNTSDESMDQTLADYQQDNHETINSTALVPVLGATATMNDSAWWIGVVGEGATQVADHFLAKCGVGYYRRQFEASKNPSIAAPMIVSATGAEMYIGHVGISYLRSMPEDTDSSVMETSQTARNFKPYNKFNLNCQEQPHYLPPSQRLNSTDPTPTPDMESLKEELQHDHEDPDTHLEEDHHEEQHDHHENEQVGEEHPLDSSELETEHHLHNTDEDEK